MSKQGKGGEAFIAPHEIIIDHAAYAEFEKNVRIPDYLSPEITRMEVFGSGLRSPPSVVPEKPSRGKSSQQQRTHPCEGSSIIHAEPPCIKTNRSRETKESTSDNDIDNIDNELQTVEITNDKVIGMKQALELNLQKLKTMDSELARIKQKYAKKKKDRDTVFVRLSEAQHQVRLRQRVHHPIRENPTIPRQSTSLEPTGVTPSKLHRHSLELRISRSDSPTAYASLINDTNQSLIFHRPTHKQKCDNTRILKAFSSQNNLSTLQKSLTEVSRTSSGSHSNPERNHSRSRNDQPPPQQAYNSLEKCEDKPINGSKSEKIIVSRHSKHHSKRGHEERRNSKNNINNNGDDKSSPNARNRRNDHPNPRRNRRAKSEARSQEIQNHDEFFRNLRRQAAGVQKPILENLPKLCKPHVSADVSPRGRDDTSTFIPSNTWDDGSRSFITLSTKGTQKIISSPTSDVRLRSTPRIERNKRNVLKIEETSDNSED